MQPRQSDQQAISKLASIKGGSTLQMMLNMARSLHAHGEKIFNSNPVLRQATLLDARAAKLRERMSFDLPNLNRSIEIGENVIRKLRDASGPEQASTVERFTAQFEAADKEASLYNSQTAATEKELKQFSKKLPEVIDRMINAILAQGSPPAYTEYLNELKESRKQLASLTSHVDMLKNTGQSTLAKLEGNTKDALTFARSNDNIMKKMGPLTTPTAPKAGDDLMRPE